MRSFLFGILSSAILIPVTWAAAQTLLPTDAFLLNPGVDTRNIIPPSPVDLLYDADSYVPPFYRGRALPSPGTTVHLQAIPRFAGAIPNSAIVYTWRRNGQVENDVSGAGRSSVALPAPTLFGTDTISVDARTADSSAYGSASITVSSVDPRPTLYQDHPLFGIEYYDALGDQNLIPDVEMTFAAVPYFAQAFSPNDPRLAWGWSVNGSPVAASTTSSAEITINAQNSSGLAALSVVLTSPTNFLLRGEGSWNVIFSRGGFGTPAGQSSKASASGGIFHTGVGQ